MNHMKKKLILSAIGVGLQTAGGICIFVAALGIGKEINQQIKKTIIKELLKQEHDKHPGNPYLFPSPVTGGMYHPDSVVKLHQKILKDAGLEHIRFHDLRHTFATLALQNGIDVKTVSSMLGHSSAGFTLATYTHATNKAQEQAAATMGNLVKQAL